MNAAEQCPPGERISRLCTRVADIVTIQRPEIPGHGEIDTLLSVTALSQLHKTFDCATKGVL